MFDSMCAARRTTSTRLTRLAARASLYHSAVTLYEAPSPANVQVAANSEAQAQAGPSTPRRSSRRVKQEPTDPETPGFDAKPAQSHTLARKTTKGTTGSPRRKGVVKTEHPVVNASPKKFTSAVVKPKSIPQTLDVPHPAPAKWAEVYAAIKEMRSRVVAPVDTMGCDQAQLREQDPKVGLDCRVPRHTCRRVFFSSMADGC